MRRRGKGGRRTSGRSNPHKYALFGVAVPQGRTTRSPRTNPVTWQPCPVRTDCFECFDVLALLISPGGASVIPRCVKRGVIVITWSCPPPPLSRISSSHLRTSSPSSPTQTFRLKPLILLVLIRAKTYLHLDSITIAAPSVEVMMVMK